jgi:serine/threonine protein kinase
MQSLCSVEQRSTEHPNVVKLFDAYKVQDHIWVCFSSCSEVIAMKVALEFMEGGNLYQILSALEETFAQMPEPQIAYVILEV